MTDRRYNDDEVATIFQRAAEDPQTTPVHVPRDEGLTLAELQEIGKEVGMSPEAVAMAAQSMELTARGKSQTLFGLPIGVERTVALNRVLTEPEWEHLVVQLREVFKARGTMSSTGSFRQWTNGNLQALLEPTPTGHRLRLRTVKGDARVSITTGLAMLVISGAVGISALAGSHLGDATSGIALLAVLGFGMIANGALRLPGWARLRGKQMESIAAGLALAPAPDAKAIAGE
ncbi:MAG: hypothetical protein ABJC74_09640 [Gemmatimonadota bacterium]